VASQSGGEDTPPSESGTSDYEFTKGGHEYFRTATW